MKLKPLKAFLFWFGLISISLLVMIQPAQASGTVSSQTIASGSIQVMTFVSGGTGLESSYSLGTASSFSIPVTSTSASVYVPQVCAVNGGGIAGGGSYQYCYVAPYYTRKLLSVSVAAGVCPANSTGTTTCTCTDPYIPNAGATACVMPACPVYGSAAGSYYVKTGDVLNSIYDGISGGSYCKDGCSTYAYILVTSSHPSLYKIVGGVKQYYSYRNYAYNGESCTAGDAQPLASTVPASDTCAPGQSIIQMGSQVRCLNPSTGDFADTNSASAVAAAKTLADAKTAKAIQDAKDAASAAGGSASDVAAAGTVAAGVSAANNSAGSGDPVMDSFCAQNPSVDICKQGTAQAKTAGVLPEIGSGSWYVKTYPDGVSGVLTTNFNAIKNTPLLGLLSNIVPTLSGAAHSGCFTIPVLNMGNQQICLSPLVMTFLGIAMMLTALFAARSIVFGG